MVLIQIFKYHHKLLMKFFLPFNPCIDKDFCDAITLSHLLRDVLQQESWQSSETLNPTHHEDVETIKFFSSQNFWVFWLALRPFGTDLFWQAALNTNIGYSVTSFDVLSAWSRLSLALVYQVRDIGRPAWTAHIPLCLWESRHSTPRIGAYWG